MVVDFGELCFISISFAAAFCCFLVFFGSNHVFCNGYSNSSLYFKPKLTGSSPLVHQKQKCDCLWCHTQSLSEKKLFFEAITLSFCALLQNPMPLFQVKISLHWLQNQTLYPCHGMAGLHVNSSFLTLFF